MLPRLFPVLSLFVFILSVLAFAGAKSTVDRPAELQPWESIIEITLKIDKAEVTPEDTVILKEVIPSAMDAKVVSINHTVVRIGRFDKKLGKLISIDRSSLYSHVNSKKEFEGLPGSLGFSHPFDFEIRTPKYKGAEFTVRPKRLGVYLIIASWLLRDRMDYISSNPVILIVRPPVDARGKPVVKPEWISKEEVQLRLKTLVPSDKKQQKK